MNPFGGSILSIKVLSDLEIISFAKGGSYVVLVGL